MSILENLKRRFESMTGIGGTSAEAAPAMVREVPPLTFRFQDDGATPNHPHFPFVVFKQAVEVASVSDPAAVFERLFTDNGWGGTWRNGVYPYLHYHSATHEVLGVARGRARVRFGGDQGLEFELTAGDVAVLPAGTGHQNLGASDDFLVVGAYPPTGDYDECRGRPEEHARAVKTIPGVPVPAKDPVYGSGGPLRRLWSTSGEP